MPCKILFFKNNLNKNNLIKKDVIWCVSSWFREIFLEANKKCIKNTHSFAHTRHREFCVLCAWLVWAEELIGAGSLGYGTGPSFG